MDSQRSHLHKSSNRVEWQLREFRGERVDFDDIELDGTQLKDEEEIAPDRPGKIVAQRAPPAWHDTSLNAAFNGIQN